MPVDVPCSHCGREPSHPQVRNRFVYAAYYRPSVAHSAAARRYVAALCAPCRDADRRAGVGTARNRFLSRVRRWSGLAGNRGWLVRLVEHPEGTTGDERVADAGFRGGVVVSGNTPARAGRKPQAEPWTRRAGPGAT